jgi:DNA repair exonuclease SbcCD ATPase subunit
MKIRNTLCMTALAAALTAGAAPAIASETAPFVSAKEVRSEISESMDAIAEYTAQERKQAVAEAEEAMNKLDAEIDRYAAAMKENWSEMSEDARASAEKGLAKLQAARTELGARYDALEAGTADAWDDLKADFAAAWDSFAETWESADNSAAVK